MEVLAKFFDYLPQVVRVFLDDLEASSKRVGLDRGLSLGGPGSSGGFMSCRSARTKKDH
jgi:hypothetical protein